MTALPQELVDLVLVYQSLEPRHQKSRHELGFLAHLALQYLIDVDCLLYYFTHCCNLDYHLQK